MHPLTQLRKIFNSQKTNQGRVISQTDSTLILATPKGSLSVARSANDGTRYQVGDTVLLANGVVVGRRNRVPTVYVL